MPDPNYLSEIEREDGTILTIRDAEAHAEINEMNPTLQEILQGVNDIKSSIGDVGEIVEEVLVGPPTLIEKTITENGTYAAEDDGANGYSSVTVNVSGGGSSGTDVIFYDYDGTIVTSYSAADFANLSAMPENPSHTGLTAQGWNWTLADAKACVAACGKLNVGQTYITSDGKTRLYFTITKDVLRVELSLALESDTELDVDWGDGSEHTRWTSETPSQSHTYASAGRYVIAIEVITGEFYLTATLSNMYKIEIGNGAVDISDSAFYSCFALSSITIPNGVTSIGDDAFHQCTALSSVTIPDGITSIADNTFYECYSLSSITIPNSVTSIGYNAFYECFALSSITIPSSVTSINDSAFYDCYALTSITFESSNPPSLDGDIGIPYTCIIRVPQGSLEAYTSAANYPDPSAYIYEEY